MYVCLLSLSISSKIDNHHIWKELNQIKELQKRKCDKKKVINTNVTLDKIILCFFKRSLYYVIISEFTLSMIHCNGSCDSIGFRMKCMSFILIRTWIIKCIYFPLHLWWMVRMTCIRLFYASATNESKGRSKWDLNEIWI